MEKLDTKIGSHVSIQFNVLTSLLLCFSGKQVRIAKRLKGHWCSEVESNDNQYKAQWLIKSCILAYFKWITSQSHLRGKDIYKNQTVQIQTKDKHLGIQSEHWLFQYSYIEWSECITLPIYFDKYWPRILLMCSQIWCKQKWTWWHDDIVKLMMTKYGHTKTEINMMTMAMMIY